MEIVGHTDYHTTTNINTHFNTMCAAQRQYCSTKMPIASIDGQARASSVDGTGMIGKSVHW